jgi:RNA polymerase sigma-70 factor, ECF subfamily
MGGSLTENLTFQHIKRWLRKESVDLSLNAESFTHLYEKTHLFVFRYVYGLSGGPVQEAEDLTAETYARAWKTSSHFSGNEQAALSWLLSIARNLAIDLSRRRKVRNVNEEIPVEILIDPQLAPEADVITREQIEILWRMLDSLSEEVREILVLRYILGWQVKQIGAHLGMTENTISVMIRRTLKTLQRDWPESQEKDHE